LKLKTEYKKKETTQMSKKNKKSRVAHAAKAAPAPKLPAMPQEYVFFNTTKTIVLINDIPQAANIQPETYSRPFTEDEVQKSATIRRYCKLGLLTLVDSNAGQGDSPMLDIEGPSKAGVPRGVTVKATDGAKGAVVFSEGKENMGHDNPAFMVGDLVSIKGPSGLQGTLEKYDAQIGRWKVKLIDGRTANVLPEMLVNHSDAVMAGPADEPQRTLSASEVLTRGIHTDKRRAAASTPQGRMHASDVLKSRVPISAQQGRPASESGVPVGGRRFRTDEVINRPPPSGEVQIETANHVDITEEVERRAQAATSRSTFVSKGKLPGEGKEVTIGEMAESLSKDEQRKARKAARRAERKAALNKGETVGDETQPAVKTFRDAKLTPAQNKEAEAWLAMKPSQKKFAISKMKDAQKLQLVLLVDDDLAVIKLVKDRMAELIKELQGLQE